MRFLEKLRRLPEFQRKLILWTIVIVLALVLFILWVRNVREKLRNFPREELREQVQFPALPNVETPEFEIPKLSEEELKQLEEQLKEAENGE